MEKSREFLNSQGDKEDEASALKIQQQAREQMYTEVSENEVENNKLKELLKLIDFEDWKAIYLEDAVRCGIDPEQINFVDAEGILNIPDRSGSLTGTGGFYDVGADMIGIDYNRGCRQARHHNVNPGVFLFYLLSHEQTHAVSKMECVGKVEFYTEEQNQSETKVSRTRSGYLQSISKKQGGSIEQADFFSAFDEAVTERYTRERVIFRYLEHHPELASKEDVAKLKKLLYQKGINSYYERELNLLDVFLRKLAQISGFDQEIVWQAVIKGKFSGEPFADAEMRALFDECFEPGFIEELAKTERDDARLFYLAEKLREGLPDDSVNIKDRIVTWLRQRLSFLNKAA